MGMSVTFTNWIPRENPSLSKIDKFFKVSNWGWEAGQWARAVSLGEGMK